VLLPYAHEAPASAGTVGKWVAHAHARAACLPSPPLLPRPAYGVLPTRSFCLRVTRPAPPRFGACAGNAPKRSLLPLTAPYVQPYRRYQYPLTSPRWSRSLERFPAVTDPCMPLPRSHTRRHLSDLPRPSFSLMTMNHPLGSTTLGIATGSPEPSASKVIQRRFHQSRRRRRHHHHHHHCNTNSNNSDTNCQSFVHLHHHYRCRLHPHLRIHSSLCSRSSHLHHSRRAPPRSTCGPRCLSTMAHATPTTLGH